MYCTQRAGCNHILLAAHGTVHLHDTSHTPEKNPQAATIPYLERNGLIACKPCGSAYAARTVSRAHCESSIGHSVSCRHLSPTLPVLCCAANRLQNTSAGRSERLGTDYQGVLCIAVCFSVRCRALLACHLLPLRSHRPNMRSITLRYRGPKRSSLRRLQSR